MSKVEVVTKFIPVLNRWESLKKIKVTDYVKIVVDRDSYPEGWEGETVVLTLSSMTYSKVTVGGSDKDVTPNVPEVVDAVVEFVLGGLMIYGRTEYHGEGLPVEMFVPQDKIVEFTIVHNVF